MTDLRNCNREFITEFIELYRSHPCLWKIKSNEYSDRGKKNKAYEKMIIKLKEVDPSATKDSVKKKIDSLRGCFRKELKKIVASKSSGAGTSEVYTPNLWYFNHLTFLRGQETPREAVNNINEDTNLTQDESSNHHTLSPPSPFEKNIYRDRTSSVCSTTKKRKTTDRVDEVLEKVSAKLDMDIKEDNFTVVGKNVANKLRQLPRDAALMAEKFINDILFDAALGNINRTTKMSLTTKEVSQEQYSTISSINSVRYNQQSAGTCPKMDFVEEGDQGTTSNSIIVSQQTNRNVNYYFETSSPETVVPDDTGF